MHRWQVGLPVLLFLLSAVPTTGAEPETIFFPRPDVRSHHVVNPHLPVSTAPVPDEEKEIPLDLLLELSNVENVTYFLSNFINPESLPASINTDPDAEISDRFGGDERKSVENAKQATCIPQLEVVKLVDASDPSLYYYPVCTRVERCSGCCGSPLLSCQPTHTEIVNFKVFVAQFKGGKEMDFKNNEIIPIERHIKCTCQCIIKETDCNQFQEYHKNECRCICQNHDEQQKCLKNNKKVWNPSTCICQCKETTQCSSGFYFDYDICRCVSTLSIRNRRGENRNKHSLQSVLN